MCTKQICDTDGSERAGHQSVCWIYHVAASLIRVTVAMWPTRCSTHQLSSENSQI